MTPNIADFLNNDDKQKLNQRLYAVGSVFIAEFDENDGITPKGNDKFRNKIFVVLGHDVNGAVLGAVFINSGINSTNRNNEVLYLHQYPLKRQDHPNIIKHDSFVNCAHVIPVYIDNLKNCKFLDKLNSDHFDLIFETVKSSPIIKNKIKKRFGLI